MGNRLYVGNLDWDTNDGELASWFEQCGTVVDAKVMIDRDSGRSRGFGFVTMASESEAQKAITELNGKELNRRPLKINEALERNRSQNNYQGQGQGQNKQGYQEGGGYGGGKRKPSRRNSERGGGRDYE